MRNSSSRYRSDRKVRPTRRPKQAAVRGRTECPECYGFPYHTANCAKAE